MFFFNLHEQCSCYFSLLWLFWKAWHQRTKLYEICLDLALVWFFSGVDPPTMDVLSEDGMFCGIDIGLKKREVLWAMHQQLPFQIWEFLKDLALSFVTLCKHFIIQPGSSPSHQHLSCWRLFCACLTRDTVLSLATSYMLNVELQCKLILHIDDFFYITCICYRFVEYNLFSNLLFLAPFIFCIFNAFLLNIYLLQTEKLYKVDEINRWLGKMHFGAWGHENNKMLKRWRVYDSKWNC